jgi:hemerythrin
MVEWNDSIATGIGSIDEQHRELFRRVNQFAAAQDTHQEKKVLLNTLGFMRLYAAFHFKEEEAVMESIGYPHLLEHKQMHAAFIEKIFDLRLEASLGDESVAKEALIYFEAWLKDHISKNDKDIGSYFAKQSVSTNLK